MYGDFNFCGGPFDGATTKTRNLFEALCERYSDVITFNLEGWRKHPFKKIFELKRKIKKVNAIVFVPGAKNGTLFAIKYLSKHKKRGTKLFYFVAGSLLPKYLSENTRYIKWAKKIDCIFCETFGLIKELTNFGLTNLYFSPTFDLRNDYGFIEKTSSNNETYRFCSFCRVAESKGVGIACDAINSINNKNTKLNIYFDIYGKLDPSFKDYLEKAIDKSMGKIRYLGILNDDEVIKTIGSYDANIFATYFEGECLPATVIESLKASTPLLISDWKYNREIIQDGVEGFVFGNTARDLENTIIEKCKFSNPFSNMRMNCYKKSKKYNKDACLKDLFKALDVL